MKELWEWLKEKGFTEEDMENLSEKEIERYLEIMEKE